MTGNVFLKHNLRYHTYTYQVVIASKDRPFKQILQL